ncbi:MAG: iron ABC transporter permease [Peptococcia bacterium]
MSYIAKRRRLKYIMILLVLVLMLVCLGASTVGTAHISLGQAIRIVVGKIPKLSSLVDTGLIPSNHIAIIWQVRMPRIILSAMIGACLAAVGACFQGLFCNPLADPYILGISNGAGLGATVAIVMGLGGLAYGVGYVSLLAFLGALITAIVVYLIANVGGRLPAVNLILSGVAVGFFASSFVTVLMALNRENTERIIMWLMGSVNAANWQQVAILFPVTVVGCLILCLFARELNAIGAGEETAKSLGVKVETVKKLLLGVSSLLVAVCVSVSGIIGFVGLVIPHVARLIVGPDQRALLPFSTVIGALFLVLCDTIARSVIPPAELPLGAVTALCGAPYFCYLLIKAKKKVRL